jgi:hypothetical protein
MNMTIISRLILTALLVLQVWATPARGQGDPFRLDSGRGEGLYRLDGRGTGGRPAENPFRLDTGRDDGLFRLDGQRPDGRRDDPGRIRHEDRHDGRPGGIHDGDDRRHDRHRDYPHQDRDGRRRGDDDRRHDRHRDYRPQGSDDRRHHVSGPHDRHAPPRRVVRHVVYHIPPRHAVILHGRERYHYHAGRFYRPWNSGFVLVRPPLGLIVFSIPLGSRVVVSAGITYHVYGDVYYRRVPAGYEVVEPVRPAVRDWPERVAVATDLLNVRYGPDEGEEVIAQVDRHTILNVLGSAPGWLYVEIEGEDVRGWVVERYVTSNLGRG